MTTATAPQAHSEIYMTLNAKGAARYSHLSHAAGRLVTISKESAEFSIACGASVYQKAVGQSWLTAVLVTI